MPVLGAQTCQGIELLRLAEYSFSCCFSLTCSAASWARAPSRVKPNRARVVNKLLCDSGVLRPLGVYARKEMTLKLKRICEKCGATLTPSGSAYICSYECTFCASCAEQMKLVCPNCKGELVRRPRREPS